MSWTSLGSLSLPFQMQRHGVALRTEMARHSGELSTGMVQAPQRHLRGDLGALASIESRLSRIEAYDKAIIQNSTLLEGVQSSLQRVSALGSQLSSQVLTAVFTDSGAQSYAASAKSAVAAMEDMISALSLSVAGRTVFSGAALDRGPLPTAQDLMAEVSAHVAGLTDAQDIVDALEDFFMQPGGIFETTIYRGEGEAPRAAINDDERAPHLPNAAHPAIRSQFMATAMAALLDNGAVNLDAMGQRELALATVQAMESNNQGLTDLQAQIGFGQELLDQRRIRLSLEKDGLQVSRHGMIGVDEFQSASHLEETRHRLELLYAVTARVSRLSLLEYLR
ncbi:MAG: hypothetical protein ACK4LQ_05240 [Pararhodobacter sp.]